MKQTTPNDHNDLIATADESLVDFVPDHWTFVQRDMQYVMRYWMPSGRGDKGLVPVYKAFPKETELCAALEEAQRFPSAQYCELFVYVDLEVYDSRLKYLTRIYGEEYPDALPISAVEDSQTAYAERTSARVKD